MRAWRAYVALVAIFLLGGITGAAGMHLYRLRLERQILTGPEPVISMAVLSLDRDLDLDESQEAEVREVFRDARREILEVDPNLLPRLEAIFDRAQARVAATLTPEQRERFEREAERRRDLLRQIRRSAEEEREGK